ncbi:glycosyltransferase family 4 protein [Inconstantimicrobium mannanitabidum]|uniref:Uncharacterized protein n=1 Tax=Inconstantimicrobium mannanitabidum TaxID=1604901 RepID=A0ACB5RFF8_9CLOT|nr:glycosyltransferase family 1 protein [Clostridium sp. TW13]GKX67815.1 hypothetical protein rsdtw13_30730 [Clostridium sp. TW13]
MKVCIDAHVLGDRSGGNETYYRNIIDNIYKNLGDTDELFILLDSEEEKKRIDAKNIKNVKTIMFKYKNPIKRYGYEMAKIVKSYSIDVLHTQYYSPIIKNCKLVVTIHDVSFIHYPECFNTMELIRNRLWIRNAAKRADSILTVSEYSKQDIVKQFGVNDNKVHVTYLAPSGIFRELEDKDVEQAKEKFKIDAPYILAVGNLQPRKNLVTLINSYVKIKSSDINFKHKLVIVGKKAWKYDAIFSTLNSHNLSDDIILTDYVSEEDLVRLYNGADVFIYPSIFEGFGLPVIEAMACGTPVITSNTTSLPEVVDDAAILIDPYNQEEIVSKIEALCMDNQLKNELRGKGLKRAKLFSWETTAKKVMDVYKFTMQK